MITGAAGDNQDTPAADALPLLDTRKPLRTASFEYGFLCIHPYLIPIAEMNFRQLRTHRPILGICRARQLIKDGDRIVGPIPFIGTLTSPSPPAV